MNVSGKTIYFYLVTLFLVSGCTKMSPELGFGFLNSSDESLTIEANVSTINSTTANAVVQLKGLCEDNTNLTISAPNNFEFKCENFSYVKELPAGVFTEGENYISVDAYDNSKNKIATKKIRILKDTVAPTITLTVPGNLLASATSAAVTGTCSENSSAIQIYERNTAATGATTCMSGTWNYNFSFTLSGAPADFKFYAIHTDTAGNTTQTNDVTLNRDVLAAFNVVGVRNENTQSYGSMIKKLTGNLDVSWNAATGASTYDVYIIRNFQISPVTVCSQTGLSSTNVVFPLVTTCSLTHSENLKVKVVAWNASHTSSNTEYFDFSTKAPPTLKNDAKIIYINSDSDTAIAPVVVNYADLVEDPQSSGPFTINLTSTGTLGAAVTANNAAMTRSLTIAPPVTASGIFPIYLTITDENSITSSALEMKIAIVYPYSWTGFVNNDFNNKDNWCGSAGLKTGCAGAGDVPDFNSRVFLDNLCTYPKSPQSAGYAINCAPYLSANTTVRSFHQKATTFSQNGFTFSAGTVTDSGSYFKVSGGLFNNGTTTGDLIAYKLFLVDGGLFNAPNAGLVTLNTRYSGNGSDAFKVLNNSFYAHNGSTLKFIDPNGNGLYQNMLVPSNFELHNLVLGSTGGHWSLKSANLNITGSLELSGTKQSSHFPQLNIGSTGAKITLGGDLICSGEAGGGSLPVYITNIAAKYKTTMAGCKFPQIKIADASASMTEDAASSADSTFQTLVISAGSFKAPGGGRSLIIKTSNLDNNTIAAGLNSGGFNHNNGKIIFETADNGLNYKIELPTVNNIEFRNPSNLTSFYEIENNFTSSKFHLSGSNQVPVRGYYNAATSNYFKLDTGFVADATRLSGLIQSGFSSVMEVNTSSPINIPYLELKNPLGFSGSSYALNFSGTRIELDTVDVTIGFPYDLKYLIKTGSRNFIILGSAQSGY